jgi:PAS domain S-box-containing protein
MKSVSQPLQVLLVEDSENDAALLEIELQRAGYDPRCERVDTPETLRAALARQAWDIIIADYVMPQFNGLAALAEVKRRSLDLPFIIVSGHISDDTAVAAMKAGAHDYVMKDNLARLGPAVERELREAEVRRQRRRSEERLKVESAFRQAIENSVPSGITAVDLDGRQTYVNPAFCTMVGWSEPELVGARPPFAYWPPEDLESTTEALGKLMRGDPPGGSLELRFRRRDNERVDVLLQLTPLRDNFGNVTGWVSSVSNITERKQAEVRLAAEHQITRILANASSLAEAAPGILQVLVDGLQVEVASLWMVDSQGGLLHPSAIVPRQMPPPLRSFIEERRGLGLPPGESVPGRVWREKRALWVTDLAREIGRPGHQLAEKAGLHSAAAFPVQTADAFFGVLELLTTRVLAEDAPTRNMMTAIGSEIGQFIQRRSAEDALRRARDELEIRVRERTADLELANARLQTAIAERQRLEHELLEITERERRRIGLDLHDDLGQKLSGIALMTKGLELRLAREHAELSQDASKVHALVQEAMTHASGLARDLASFDSKEASLPAALAELASRARDLFDISCRFKPEGDIPPLPPETVKQLYKIAQEAVTNAIKHGKAKRVGISLARGPDQLSLTIHNNGLPFPDLKSHSTGMGLRIMNYRANLIGARLDIKGTGLKGTMVTCVLPLEPAQPGNT